MRHDKYISQIQDNLQELEQHVKAGNMSIANFEYGMIFGKLMILLTECIITNEEYDKYNRLVDLIKWEKEGGVN
jgi:hypothetical protein